MKGGSDSASCNRKRLSPFLLALCPKKRCDRGCWRSQEGPILRKCQQRFVRKRKREQKEKVGRLHVMYDACVTLRCLPADASEGTGDFHPHAAPFPPATFRLSSPLGSWVSLNWPRGLPGGRVCRLTFDCDPTPTFCLRLEMRFRQLLPLPQSGIILFQPRLVRGHFHTLSGA